MPAVPSRSPASNAGRKRKLKDADVDSDHLAGNGSSGEEGPGGLGTGADAARTQELLNRIAEVEEEKKTILEGERAPSLSVEWEHK